MGADETLEDDPGKSRVSLFRAGHARRLAEKGELNRRRLPLLAIQNEVRKVVLEMHALDHRLASLQNAIGLKPDGLHKNGRAQWTDTHELALWVAIERGRENLDTLVLEHLQWASRIPEGYPETVMPPDYKWQTKHIKAGTDELKRRIGKRHRAGRWWRSHPDENGE